MKKTFLTTSNNGLRLRTSPFDGDTIAILPHGTRLTSIKEQTWVQVSTTGGQTGYVLKDFLEPAPDEAPIEQNIIEFVSANHSFASDQPIYVHTDFAAKLTALETAAAERQIKILVTSSLRSPQQQLTNTVVTPAKLSNHFVGHAIDVNFICDDICYGSQAFATNQAVPQSIYDCIGEAVAAGLRWGGYFRIPDYPHFDDKLNISNPDEYMKKFKSLWS